jgi:hypothetical protein
LSEEDENETMFIRKLVRKQEVVDPTKKCKAKKTEGAKNKDHASSMDEWVRD